MAYFESPTLDEQTDRMSGATPEGDGAAFRLAMREFANGVALVATGRGDQRSGCTATSLCSLSLDPPSLLVCLTRASATLASLRNDKQKSTERQTKKQRTTNKGRRLSLCSHSSQRTR